MSSWNGEDIFGSGPHEFVLAEVAQRVARHVQPGADGAALTSLGRGERRIVQRGTLMADDGAGLEALRMRIEEVLGEPAGELVDHLGVRHVKVLMTRFSPKGVRWVGPRLMMEYEIQYLQG